MTVRVKYAKEVLTMAKCAVCGKSVHFGNAVSHSHRRSNKMWKPNIKSVKVKAAQRRCQYVQDVYVLEQ